MTSSQWLTIAATIAAVLSALVATIAAVSAYHSKRDAARRDRENRVREVSLLANKVVAATVRVDDMANKLKIAYTTLATFAGQGPGSSVLRVHTKDIEDKQIALGSMQAAARDVLDNKPARLTDEQINERVLEFEGYVAQLDRVKEKFSADLASVEAQNQTFREKTIDRGSRQRG